MAEKKRPRGIAETVFALAVEPIRQAGLILWDADYYKEGADHTLLLVIDKENGVVDLDDCERISRLISPILDEVDPIPESYYLEVSSPGTQRVLRREEHFLQYLGKKIAVRLYAPMEGKRIREGVLLAYRGNTLLILSDGKEIEFSTEQVAKVNALDEE